MSSLTSKVNFVLELNSDQLSLLKEFKLWVEEEADFYGRSEENFLVQFLHSCNFNLKMSKTTLNLYYQARVKKPEWWLNRNLNHPQLQFLLKECFILTLMDSAEGNSPTVTIFYASRTGPDASILAHAGMYATCNTNLMTSRSNCQLNGATLIFDLSNCHSWLMWKLLWPPFIRDLVNSFLLGMPFKMMMVVLVNAPAIASTLVNILRSLIPDVYKNKIQCCTGWSDVGKFIPPKALPVEYGGCNRSIEAHKEAYINELLTWNEYFVDDNKYGFHYK